MAIVAAPTNPHLVARPTGLWTIAARFPVIAGHTSIFMAGIAGLGVLALMGLLFAAPLRQRLIFLAAIAGFIIANTANNDLFQRYVDPFALMSTVENVAPPPPTDLPPPSVR